MSASDYLEKKIIDHVLGKQTYTPPDTIYIGLTTVAVVDADTGSTVTEPSSGAYARVAVTNNATNFPNATGTSATKSNGTDIVFPEATASWGTVTHFFYADALTGGNILFHGELTSPAAVGTGVTPKFSTGSLTITGN